MYFKPRDSKWYSRLVSIKPIVRYAMTAIILVCIIFVWLLLFYWPINRYIQCIAHECKVIDQYYAQAKEAENAHGALKESVCHLQAQYNKKDNLDHPLAVITRSAQQSHTKLTHCIMQDKKVHDWYTAHKMLIQGTGILSDIIQLFNALEHTLLSCVIEKFTLTRSADHSCAYSCSLIYHHTTRKSPST